MITLPITFDPQKEMMGLKAKRLTMGQDTFILLSGNPAMVEQSSNIANNFLSGTKG